MGVVLGHGSPSMGCGTSKPLISFVDVDGELFRQDAERSQLEKTGIDTIRAPSTRRNHPLSKFRRSQRRSEREQKGIESAIGGESKKVSFSEPLKVIGEKDRPSAGSTFSRSRKRKRSKRNTLGVPRRSRRKKRRRRGSLIEV